MVFAKNSARRAFTLIELLVVIVVIAVLAAIIIPKFTDQSRRSKEAALKSNLSLIRTALATCQADTALYPASLADLTSTTAPATSGWSSAGVATAWAAGTWHGPYVQGSIPVDPVSGSALAYTGSTGTVSASATGNDSAGVAFSTY